MTLRLAAALALLLGVAGLLGYLYVVGKAPFSSLEARHLREMKDRLDPPASVDTMTFADFAALPHGRPVAEYSGIERRGAVLEGHVWRMVRSSDDDLHLEIVDHARRAGSTDTAHITVEITPQWRRGSSNWKFERLAAALRPSIGSRQWWLQPPRRARLSGWLLYDFQYDAPYGEPLPRPIGGRAHRTLRLTGWEIHPVTRIEVWDDSLASFVEIPR